ncbi:Hypothetical protein A7982_11114 [Minicystis rosea]|nr:Hypothetical protein A7982_11114 [Minicystis rosea]
MLDGLDDGASPTETVIEESNGSRPELGAMNESARIIQ